MPYLLLCSRRSERRTCPRVALLIALNVLSLAACGTTDKTAASAGQAASSTSSSTGPSPGEPTSSGSTSGATTSSTSTSDAISSSSTSTGSPWPPVQCGDGVCAVGDVCVIDLYAYCCRLNVAASTGGDTDSGTTTGAPDSGTTTGGDTDTGTTSETTDDGCRDIYEATYTCKPFPDACPSETLTLVDCLQGQLCDGGGLFDPEFDNGVLDCGTLPHECY